MRCRKTVLQAMRAAGISRDVSTDAADRLRRRIGRVEIFLAADASVTSRLMTPGSTTTRAFGRSTSRMRFIRARLMTIPFQRGARRPLNPVPEPPRHERDSFTVTNSDNRLNLLVDLATAPRGA